MKRLLTALALVVFLSHPLWAAAPSPAQTLTTFLRALQNGDDAACWSLLSNRSQSGMANTFSHTFSVPPDEAWQSLGEDDERAAAFWGSLRRSANLPASGLVHVRTSGAEHATVVLWNQNAQWAFMEENVGGWKLQLLETVLPSWLAVEPYTGPPPSRDYEGVVVVGENPQVGLDNPWPIGSLPGCPPLPPP